MSDTNEEESMEVELAHKSQSLKEMLIDFLALKPRKAESMVPIGSIPTQRRWRLLPFARKAETSSLPELTLCKMTSSFERKRR